MSVIVRIDPTKCRGHAICALFFSEGVELDRWGFGRIVATTTADRRSVKRALRAAAACPNGAVVVMEHGSGAGVGAVRRDDPHSCHGWGRIAVMSQKGRCSSGARCVGAPCPGRPGAR